MNWERLKMDVYGLGCQGIWPCLYGIPNFPGKFLEASCLLISYTTHPPLCCSNYCGKMEKKWDFNINWKFIKICLKSGMNKDITYHSGLPCGRQIPPVFDYQKALEP